MISTFHKDHPEKLTAMLSLIDSALLMVKSIATLIAMLLNVVKRKHSQPAKAFLKQIRDVYIYTSWIAQISPILRNKLNIVQGIDVIWLKLRYNVAWFNLCNAIYDLRSTGLYFSASRLNTNYQTLIFSPKLSLALSSS